jgi:hypothetical protein
LRERFQELNSMETQRIRNLVSALVLFGIAIYFFATFTSSLSYQSTFTIPSGDYYYYITSIQNPGDSITGNFFVTTGNPVSFYIMDSTQFASFQTGISVTSVYSVADTTTGSISYAFIVQDTYYLVFQHGAGQGSSIQTVFFQRAYQIRDILRIELGITFLLIGVVDLVFAVLPSKSKPIAAPPTPPFQLGHLQLALTENSC